MTFCIFNSKGNGEKIMKNRILFFIILAVTVNCSFVHATQESMFTLFSIKEPSDETQWIEQVKSLKPAQQERIISFLQALCNTLPDMMSEEDTPKRKKIEDVLGKAIAHTEQELKKIAIFMQLVESIHPDQTEFNIPKMVESSTPSQGQNRTNTSVALKEIIIQEPSLLDIQSVVDNAIKKVTTTDLKEILKQEATVFILMKQAYTSATAVLEDDSVKLYCDLLEQLQNKAKKEEKTNKK